MGKINGGETLSSGSTTTTIASNNTILGPSSSSSTIQEAFEILDLDKMQRPMQANYVFFKDLPKMKVQAEKRLKDIEKCIERLESLKYQPGDVVYHKEYGNGVICDISIEDGWTLDMTINLDSPVTGYKVRFANHDSEFIKQEELLPYNHATQVLYGKKGKKEEEIQEK